MTIGARGHPTHHFALMPNGLIANGIRIRVEHFESHQPKSAAAFLLFRRGGTADEFVFLEVDEAAQARLERSVDGTILPGPGPEAFLHPHGIQGPSPETAQA